jgi:hypothetical protein
MLSHLPAIPLPEDCHGWVWHWRVRAGRNQAAATGWDAVKAAHSGDMQTAASEIKAAAKKLEAGSKAMDAAVTDMETFEASG